MEKAVVSDDVVGHPPLPAGTRRPVPVPLAAQSPFELRVGLGSNVADADVRVALATGDVGFVHSFTTGSTVDGPGVRIVAWTAGCMWRCQYCHNPDTWTMTNGMPVTIAKATDELRKYRHGLEIMSGGLTISGGEALMQHRFVVKLFAAAKAMGIHTALDTNGYYGDRLTDEELEKIDLVLLDMKTWDSERHQRLTGMDVARTLLFALRLAARRRKVWVRFVLIPGWTDDFDDIGRIAGFAAGLGNVERVDVLPFHQLGRYKWKKLGMNYTLENVEPPSNELVERACAIFRAAGLEAY
jgi:pyruvate formate lyase activating enzyme